MRVAIVGRGRLGAALGAAACSADHEVTLLRRPDAPAGAASAGGGPREDALGPDLDWAVFDLVLLAFEKRASEVSELERDAALRELRRIPASVPIASAVWSPAPALVEAFLPRHAITRFTTTPAAQLPGATALRLRTDRAPAPVEKALSGLHWIEADERDYLRLGTLLVGSAMAAAALGHLAQILGEDLSADVDLADHVLDDARRLLRLAEGDALGAFASVATPGGLTERLHNRIFARRWPLED